MSLFSRPKIPAPPKLNIGRQNRKAAEAARLAKLDSRRGVNRQATILGAGLSPLGPTTGGGGGGSQVARQTTLG
jgi:hypothetical protein